MSALAWFVALGLTTALGQTHADLWVSPAGAAGNIGTREKPLASLEAARDATRRLKASGQLPPQGFTIWLQAGDYPRTNALELTAADSGTAAAPITWRAEEGKVVRLLGGQRLAGFQPVTDQDIVRRLAATARGQVLQIDLRKLGVTDFGDMQSRGFGRPVATAHCELFFAGKPMTLARWPNDGEFARIAGFPTNTAQEDGHGGKIGKLENGFTYDGDRPQSWRDTRDLWVHGYWAWDWANSYERVVSLDPQQRLVKTAPPYGQYGFRQDQRFYFLNVLEELDRPGEWFLDRASGMLYFWPPQPIGAHEILLSLSAEPLIRLNGASNVALRGLTLEATRGHGVEMRGGAGNRIAGCTLRNLGNSGVVVEGGEDHGVIACDLFDTGDGGVSLTGGDRQTLRSGGHFVENCHFARQGRWSKCYVPAVHLQGVGLRASHNLIHEHPHCAILFWGNDHLIDHNEIHHIALETGDVGAVYTGRDFTFRGNRIRNNFIHHTGGVGMGSMGVYMDDCVSGTEIAGNIFYQVQRAAFLGGGRDHVVTNNIFVDCDHAVELDGRGLDQAPVWRDMVDKTMRAHLTEVPLALYRERYPALRSLDAVYGPPGGPPLEGTAFKGVPPEGNVVERNVSVGKWLHVYWHAKPEMLRLAGNLTNQNPRFVGQPGQTAAAGAFALASDSPAWALGFQPIKTGEIGLQADVLRRELDRRQPASAARP